MNLSGILPSSVLSSYFPFTPLPFLPFFPFPSFPFSFFLYFPPSLFLFLFLSPALLP